MRVCEGDGVMCMQIVSRIWREGDDFTTKLEEHIVKINIHALTSHSKQ